MLSSSLRLLVGRGFFITMSTIFTLSAAHAGPTPAVIAKPDSSCATSTDPNETPYRLTETSKKFPGQCIDSSRFRSIKNYKAEANVISFNNFQHENSFWQAQMAVTPENVEAVYMQVLRFPVLGVVQAGHAEFRFKLKNPVQLTSQTDTNKKTTLSDVVVSYEAAFPKSESYNFALGAVDNYALIGRVMSLGQKRLDSTKAPFEQYELSLTADEKSQLLKNSLSRAVAGGMDYPYNTLRPNCATEVFDLVDELPRFKGRFLPFLTVISTDPVGAPTIAALQQRQILKARVQDYSDEEKGILNASVPLPTGRSIPMLPDVSGKPWTLVLTLPNLDRLSATERQTILKIREQVLAQAPLALQGVGSAMMTEAGANTSAVISGVLSSLQSRIMKILKESNALLPTSRQQMGLYIVPFNSSVAQTRLDNLGLPAALPFTVVNAVVDETIAKSNEIYFHIAEGARLASDAGSKNSEVGYFMASAIRLNLQRDNIQVRAQMLVGLNNQTKPIAIKNSQVTFQNSVISGAESRSTRPVMLITHAQVGVDVLNPSVRVDFGPEGGIAGTAAGEAFGVFQINKNLSGSCEMQAASSPTLNGNLSATALGKPILDSILKGKKVAFRILSARLDVQTQNVTEMDVRISTWPVQCVSNDAINNQFRQNANQMLEKLKTEARGDLLPKLLSGFLRNN